MSTTTETRTHHPDSASGLQPAEWCERYRPISGDNEASQAGTRCHAACETRNVDGLTEEQGAAVWKCLEFLDALVEEKKKEWGRAPHIIKEQYLPVDDDTAIGAPEWKGITGGFNDVALVSRDHKKAVVLDYKFVNWAVEDAETNLQGITYMLGLRHKFKTLEEVEVYFLMPYLDKVSYHKFTADQFPELYLRLRRLVLRRYAEDAIERPSWGTCMFCSRIASCKAIGEAMAVLGKKYDPLHWPASVDPMTIHSAKTSAKDRIKCADIATAWGKATRAVVTDLVASGEIEVPEGYTLANQADRIVADADKLLSFVGAATNTPVIDLLKLQTPSITKLEAHVKSKAPKGLKDSTADTVMGDAESQGWIKRDSPKIFLRAKKERAQD